MKDLIKYQELVARRRWLVVGMALKSLLIGAIAILIMQIAHSLIVEFISDVSVAIWIGILVGIWLSFIVDYLLRGLGKYLKEIDQLNDKIAKLV